MESEIEGVVLKPLKTHRDQRGFFREIVRFSDPFFDGFGQERAFAQWSHSAMVKDVVKAWHYHHVQYDWWYIGFGQVETVLFDLRPESPTFQRKMVFRMGDGATYGPETLEVCVKIPPGVAHGLRVLSSEAHILYITSEVYNPNEEGRIPFDSPKVPHQWGPGALVVDNDKRDFVPTSIRIPIR